jgi:hypothetical protein
MNPLRKLLIGGALATGALTGGAIGASFLGTAGAATSTTSPAATATAPAPDPTGDPGPHEANGKTETLLTGDDAAKATAAAEAAVPGATSDRAENDAEGAAYEVHMTKTDSSKVTVKLDSAFNVIDTIDGMG